MKQTAFLLSIILIPCFLFSQKRCQEEKMNSLQDHKKLLLEKESTLFNYTVKHPQWKTNSIITIPVVIHILWNTPSQNISNAQVMSQMTILNKDFRRSNADTVDTPLPFQSIAADAQLEFCLAQRDPAGNPTTGITRRQTTVFSFSPLLGDTAIYYTSTGGEDAWDTASYMNIWVCNNGGGMATWPGSTSFFPGLQDGVILDPLAFGDTGTVVAPTNKGRLADHEIGHYFFLLHPWGADTIYCATDSVADTPPQKIPTLGCPTFPVLDSCTPNFPGITYNVYMDYTDDSCMNMFTAGEAARMNLCIQVYRSTLLNSMACIPPAGYAENANEPELDISPNPSGGIFNVYLETQEKEEFSYTVFNDVGQLQRNGNFAANVCTNSLDLSGLSPGMYFLKLVSSSHSATRKLIIR